MNHTIVLLVGITITIDAIAFVMRVRRVSSYHFIPNQNTSALFSKFRVARQEMLHRMRFSNNGEKST